MEIKKENNNKEEVKKEGKEIKLNEKTELKNKYNKMENNDADKILCDGLKKIYNQIKINNIEFKNEVFYKNFNHLINEMGTFDKKVKNYVPTKNTQEILDNVLPPDILVEKYTEKAKKMKD